MRIGSLCAGYGGLDMAVEQVLGGELAWVSEVDPAASTVLAHHWDVPNHGDLTVMDWSKAEPVDVLTAGWPCQPWSLAGKRKGAEDERAIWPDVARAVRDLRPRLVFLENVSAIVGLGELARAVGDLAECGYVGSWVRLPASGVGAPHRRMRVFIAAADTSSDGRHEGRPEPAGLERGSDAALRCDAPTHAHGAVVRDKPRWVGGQDGASEGVAGDDGPQWGAYGPAIGRWGRIIGRPAPAPTVAGQRSGQQLSPRFVEWMQGLPEGHVTDVGLKRNDQLRLLGNGVVPLQGAVALRHLLNVSLERAA